jgi:thiol-disulfide isomerase/thioredoxin
MAAGHIPSRFFNRNGGFMKVVASALTLCLLLMALPVQSAFVATPHLDKVRAQEFEVVSLNGKTVWLAELMGTDRPVVIHFWATWCAPCRQEIPQLNLLSQMYRDQGLTVIGLTLDEEHELVKLFMKEHKVTYPIAFASTEVFHFFNQEGGNVALPRLFVYDKRGKATAKFGKFFGARSLQQQRAAIEDVVPTTKVE